MIFLVDGIRYINYLFKQTNWKKFNKHLEKSTHQNIPAHINLSIQQIQNEIHAFTNRLLDAIKHTVPKYKPTDSVQTYVDKNIIHLKKHKKYLLNLKRNNRHTDIHEEFNPKFLKNSSYLLFV